VIYGTALAYGFDLDAVIAEVHRSNMTKLGEDGKPIYRESDGKVLKSKSYVEADVAKVLGL
jgi:predicted HAD superfamily Cof-like phosphohydrolase